MRKRKRWHCGPAMLVASRHSDVKFVKPAQDVGTVPVHSRECVSAQLCFRFLHKLSGCKCAQHLSMSC